MSERIDRDALIEVWHGYGRPRETWLVGGEFERAVVRRDGSPVGYFEPDGIRDVLEGLATDPKASWRRVYEGDNVIALEDGRASITLEPGGQVELSGAPWTDLNDLAAELLAHRARLLEISEGKDLVWITTGLTPYPRIADVPFVPKSRYDVMGAYLPSRGDLAHAMMKGTTSVQANFDYLDEADCARKVRLVSRIAPLTTAMFANSPIFEGRDTGYQSYRAHVWTRTDPARTGFPRTLRETYSHEGWVDYLLDTPMMFWHDGERYRPAHGVTFRAWMTNGIDGRWPTLDDWIVHQTSVFPEVRVKRTIEVRGADCVSAPMALSFCALFTGLLYCRRALDEALALAEDFTQTGTVDERFAAAAQSGLDASIGGRSYASWARDLLDIATRGMARCHEAGLPMLQPLQARVDAGRSPARDVQEAWARDPSPEAFLPTIAY
jgi:glutamate--cysteine ligase